MLSIRPLFRRLAIAISTTSVLMPLLFGGQTHAVSAALTIVDSNSLDLVWEGSWGTWVSDTAYGGSIRYTTNAGASVSYTFTGSSITYVYTMAYNRGGVEVYIDGVHADKIVDRLNGHIDDWSHNPYTRIPRRQTAKTYSGLGSGQHTITLKAVPGDDALRIHADLDAFIINPDEAGDGTYDDTSSYATTFNQANWHTWTCSDCYNGSYKYTTVAGAGVRFTFEGDSITWYYTKAANRGKAGVTIDGENKNWQVGYFDLYNPETQRGRSTTFSGLGGGIHTITIYNIGQKNPASSDYLVDFDRFVVGATKSYQRTNAANYADARTHYYDYPSCYYKFDDPPYVGCYIAGNDCMNFASQVLHNGGYPYSPTPWTDWPEKWWFDVINKTSSTTWRYVPTFMIYQNDRPTEFARTNALSNLRKGDLIPLDLWDQNGDPGQDNVPDHMRVVVGAGLSSPYNLDYLNGPNLVQNPIFGMLIDQHSGDRWQVPWDYNVPQAAKLPFIRIIKN